MKYIYIYIYIPHPHFRREKQPYRASGSPSPPSAPSRPYSRCRHSFNSQLAPSKSTWNRPS